LADYYNMNNDSMFHVLDRLTAAPAMMLEMGKLATMAFHGERPVTMALYALAILMALYAFGQSQVAQAKVDRDGFVLWHTLWHMYPILAIAIVLADRHLLSAFEIHYERKQSKKAA
jgi:hypothetical protein